jgi:hypothetical protein
MPSATATKNGKPKTLPAHKVRCGSTEATIWQNEGENGPWFNTTVVRFYRVEESEEYEETNSYAETQLLELAAAATLAHSWIVARQAELRAERRGKGLVGLCIGAGLGLTVGIWLVANSSAKSPSAPEGLAIWVVVAVVIAGTLAGLVGSLVAKTSKPN